MMFGYAHFGVRTDGGHFGLPCEMGDYYTLTHSLSFFRPFGGVLIATGNGTKLSKRANGRGEYFFAMYLFRVHTYGLFWCIDYIYSLSKKKIIILGP